MTPHQAAMFLADQAVMAGDSPDDMIRPWGPNNRGYAILLQSPAEAARAFTLAAKRLHPDTAATGNPDLFRKATTARTMLIAHHGGRTK